MPNPARETVPLKCWLLNVQGAGLPDGGELWRRQHEGGRQGVQGGGAQAQTRLLGPRRAVRTKKITQIRAKSPGINFWHSNPV
jgi:hypothetical protein